jgi:hypothetical protein
MVSNILSAMPSIVKGNARENIHPVLNISSRLQSEGMVFVSLSALLNDVPGYG